MTVHASATAPPTKTRGTDPRTDELEAREHQRERRREPEPDRLEPVEMQAAPPGEVHAHSSDDAGTE